MLTVLLIRGTHTHKDDYFGAKPTTSTVSSFHCHIVLRATCIQQHILTVSINRYYICLLLAEFFFTERERMMCGAAVSVLLFLLWSLVEVHSQTAPYLSFMGETLSNHSYVNLSLVGGLDSGDEVICHTDLSTCCGGNDGPDRGDWYFPDGDRLPFPGNHPLVERRLQQRVELHVYRGDRSAPSGIYHCSIETRAVHSDDTTRETVYVGLYESGGDHAIIIIHSDKYCKLYTDCM